VIWDLSKVPDHPARRAFVACGYPVFDRDLSRTEEAPGTPEPVTVPFHPRASAG
jgi:hypothetical protein